MTGVGLPPELASGVVKLPKKPNDDPTAGDVVRAAKYAADVEKAYWAKMRGANVSDLELAEAYMYRTNIFNLFDPHVGPPPQWFRAVVQPVLDHKERRICQLEAQMVVLLGKFNVVERNFGIMHNRQCEDGNNESFVEIKFVDGSEPTLAPHNLPLLSNLQDLTALTDADLDTYCLGYYPDVVTPASRDQRLAALARAIGCTSAI